MRLEVRRGRGVVRKHLLLSVPEHLKDLILLFVQQNRYITMCLKLLARWLSFIIGRMCRPVLQTVSVGVRGNVLRGLFQEEPEDAVGLLLEQQKWGQVMRSGLSGCGAVRSEQERQGLRRLLFGIDRRLNMCRHVPEQDLLRKMH